MVSATICTATAKSSLQTQLGLPTTIKYVIQFQNEVKQCMRSLVQSLVKANVFLNFYFTFTSLEVLA